MGNVQDPSHPTGVTTTPGDNGGSALTKARMRKAQSAVQLKVDGYKLEDIAVALGYPSGAAVGTAIEVALSHELRETDKDTLRGIAVRRLEQAWRSVNDKIKDPSSPDHLGAVNAGVKIIDRHAKLLGLDAPTELVVSTPSAQELQAYVDEVITAKQTAEGTAYTQIVEADILEGEWVEGDDEDDDLVEVPDEVEET